MNTGDWKGSSFHEASSRHHQAKTNVKVQKARNVASGMLAMGLHGDQVICELLIVCY